MGILKANSSYGGECTLDLGDEDANKELAGQLTVKTSEIARAVNDEGLADAVFSRILKNRAADQQTLIGRLSKKD